MLTFNLDVILQSDLVYCFKANDKCVFTGTIIVVPDISHWKLGESSWRRGRSVLVSAGLEVGA